VTTTLADLRLAVDRRLGNRLEKQNAEAGGDGTTADFKLPDENIESVSLVTVESTPYSEDTTGTPGTGEFYVDTDSGWLTLGDTPGDGDALVFWYTFKRWSSEQVDEAVNSAVDYIFGEFYGRAVDDTYVIPDGSTYEFWIPQCEQLHEVAHAYTGCRYERLEDWRTLDYPDYIVTADTDNYLATTGATALDLAAGQGAFVTAGDYIKDDASAEVVYVSARTDDALTVERAAFGTSATTHAASAVWRRWATKKLVFAHAPASGSLRLLMTRRASWLASDTQSLEITCGLPQRAKEPIICYACYLLLMQRANARVMDDRSHNQLDENVVLPSDIMRQAQTMKFACDTQLAKTRMKPVRKRVVI